MKIRGGCGCLWWLSVLLLTALLLFALYPWLLTRWAYSVMRADSLEKADVIVVMAGTYAIRPQEAAALYRERWSSRILLTQERPAEDLRQLRSLRIAMPDAIDVNQQVLE